MDWCHTHNIIRDLLINDAYKACQKKIFDAYKGRKKIYWLELDLVPTSQSSDNVKLFNNFEYIYLGI